VLARKYVHLEERNASLRAEMDRLRKKHEEDHRHWKEYKRVEEARQERKKERRRVKKEKSATASLSGQTGGDRQVRPNFVLVEESEESGRKGEPQEPGLMSAVTHPRAQVSIPVQVQIPQALSTPTASQTAEGGRRVPLAGRPAIAFGEADPTGEPRTDRRAHTRSGTRSCR
jgi:hypothetical protein